jgi:hypothetical protein
MKCRTHGDDGIITIKRMYSEQVKSLRVFYHRCRKFIWQLKIRRHDGVLNDHSASKGGAGSVPLFIWNTAFS